MLRDSATKRVSRGHVLRQAADGGWRAAGVRERGGLGRTLAEQALLAASVFGESQLDGVRGIGERVDLRGPAG
jgi:hypothetical protein